MKKVLYTILAILAVCSIQTFSQGLGVQNSIALTVKPIKLTKDAWEFEINIKNNFEKSIYLMTEPTQINEKKGYYLKLDKTDKTLLNISSRVFPPQLNPPYSDSTSVKLIKLKPNEIFTENILLRFPINETSPPIGSFPEELVPKIQNGTFTKEDFENLEPKYREYGKTLNSKAIQLVKFSYGYFIEESGIVDFLKRKPQGWFINGSEPVLSGDFNGKQLREIQNLVTSEPLKTTLNNEK